jgi:uncharacterized protein (TIGR03083 family)
MTTRPDRTEAAAYYFTYIDLVPDGDICHQLGMQGRDVCQLLRGISGEQSHHRYAPGKWSLRELVQHLSDTERLFCARAFWFARGFDTPMPSFDQHVALAATRADQRPWSDLVDEFEAVRAATLPFFRSLPDEAWGRRGIASGHPFSVRALAYLAVGHVTHHVQIVRDRYRQP